MVKMLKKVRKAKLLVVSALNLLIRGAEAGAATAALLAQAHNRILPNYMRERGGIKWQELLQP